ncbi:MAG: helix-turn-helix transcriptional regulator [Ardenticatenaceae bacterium]|nr:helix-turn-helix transcriptional regulator [Ardenticatenaceae bacterium]
MYPEASTDYLLIEQAINYLEQNYRQQPDLQAVADYVGLSEYHFQRLFTRWVGISPKNSSIFDPRMCQKNYWLNRTACWRR